MKRFLLVCIMISGLLFFTSNVSASTIGIYDMYNSGGGYGIASTLYLEVYMGMPEFFSGEGLFDDIIFDPSNVGETFIATQATEPDFNSFVQMLTNGVNDGIGYMVAALDENGMGGGGDYGTSEANAFFGDPTGANGIDFMGYDINYIALQINALTLNSPGSNPNGDGIWTDVLFDATLIIDGQPAVPVPEPLSLLLYGAGLLGLAGLNKRKKSV